MAGGLLASCRFPRSGTSNDTCMGGMLCVSRVGLFGAATSMVAITDYRMSRLGRLCHRSRRKIMARHVLGHELVDMAELVRLYLRCRCDMRLMTGRCRPISMSSFNLNAFSKADGLSLFHFEPDDIGRVAGASAMRETSSRRRYRVSGEESMCIELGRLSSPSRWRYLAVMFGRCASALSEVFIETVEDLLGRWGACVTAWWTDLLEDRAFRYANCMAERGAPHEKVVGFIDGTGIRVARSGGGLQRCMYSGHKRDNVMNFQSAVTPEGLLFHLYGPVEGRRHDMTMYNESGMDNILSENLVIDGVQYSFYGDKAYFLRLWMQVAYTGELAIEQEEYNAAMNALQTPQ